MKTIFILIFLFLLAILSGIAYLFFDIIEKIRNLILSLR